MKSAHTKWWMIAIGWCTVIALATRQPFFTGDSTEQLLDNPLFNSEILNYYIRKAVHLVAFGLLAVFFWLALREKPFRYLLAWGLATIYGAIDEWHQSFIPDRSALVTDVLIDSVGAVFSLVIVYVVQKKAEEE